MGRMHNFRCVVIAFLLLVAHGFVYKPVSVRLNQQFDSCQTRCRKGLLVLGVEDNSGVESESIILAGNGTSGGVFEQITRAATVFYKFSRPHTIKGTMLASTMGVSRALMENPSSLSFKLVPRAVIGLAALLCGNAYIVGINQIYDVKIDEVRQ